jgi:protein-tyrosine phosphatase
VIDLHCHLLPGVDDGAPTLAAALAMLRIAAADGASTMVTTPHQRHPAGYDVTPERAAAVLEELRAAAREAGLDIEIRLGAEIHFAEDLLVGLESGRLLPLSPGGRHVLLELPVTFLPPHLPEAIFELQTAGYRPVLAHPERNFELIARPAAARALREKGVLMQITAQSLTGAFGRASRKAARKLLTLGVVDVIASDAHNPDRRPPGLRAAVKAAAKIVGPARAEEMVTEGPALILADRVGPPGRTNVAGAGDVRG